MNLIKQENSEYTTIATCDDNGISYLCSKCLANYSNELDAILCCINSENGND